MNRWQKQTIFGKDKGNCFAACIASLLNVPLNTIPNFVGDACSNGDETKWFENLLKWLKPKGLSFIEVMYDKNLPLIDGQLCTFTGKSPRGDFKHCVIGKYHKKGRKFEIIFDPHPDDTGLDDEIELVGIFVLIDPIEFKGI